MAKKKAKKAKRRRRKRSQPVKKAKASKRVALPRRAAPAKSKAAKKKVAARSTASRKAVPAKPQSTLTTAGNIARGVAAMAIATVARRLPWTKDENDPIELLKTDHRRFEKLLEGR